MKVSNFKRLIKEDVDPQYRAFMEKLGYSINPFAEEIINALNNNLTIADNFAQKLKDITVQVDASGSPTPSLQFKTGFSTNCIGIKIIRAVNLTNPIVYPTAAPFVSYTESNGILTVNNIAGLPANNKFNIRLLLFN